jgi:filamentous hemagglutinin family protein
MKTGKEASRSTGASFRATRRGWGQCELVAGVAALALIIAIAPGWAQQLPTGGSVAAGGVTIGTPTNGTLNINQSTNQAIINWQTFSVGQGGTVNFNQPSAASATLNRVTSSTPSSIAGTINAPGVVMLVNPNGIVITKSGVINTGSFAASTLDIKNEDFLAGHYTFRGTGDSRAVVNNGRINVSDGGFVALLGGHVANNGVITARLGRIGLGAGEMATLDLAGDGFLSVAVPSSQLRELRDINGRALVTNRGQIIADGGTVVLRAATAANMLRDAVNVPGSIRANSVGARNGTIIIGGGPGGIVRVSGQLTADSRGAKAGQIAISGAKVAIAQKAKISAGGQSGGNVSVAATGDLSIAGTIAAVGTAGPGGHIDLSGANIALTGATVDAAGGTGGGLVHIGGAFQGGNGNPSSPLYHIASAQTVTVDSATKINVSATGTGNGGTVIIWSNQHTNFAGQILATGGPGGGNGGFVETSGKTLEVLGNVNASAPNGAAGTWLLDPNNVTIQTAGIDTNITGCPNCATTNDSAILGARASS